MYNHTFEILLKVFVAHAHVAKGESSRYVSTTKGKQSPSPQRLRGCKKNGIQCWIVARKMYHVLFLSACSVVRYIQRGKSSTVHQKLSSITCIFTSPCICSSCSHLAIKGVPSRPFLPCCTRQARVKIGEDELQLQWTKMDIATSLSSQPRTH